MTEGKEEVFWVTEDRCLKEGGQLDPTDLKILAVVEQGGRNSVRVINVREMMDFLQNTDPEMYQQFYKEMERAAGRTLSYQELGEFAEKSNPRLDEFMELVKPMTLWQAIQVRQWRVEARQTWRALARSAYSEKWFAQRWEPPSNQLMGMALASKAANLFKENYRKEPWN